LLVRTTAQVPLEIHTLSVPAAHQSQPQPQPRAHLQRCLQEPDAESAASISLEAEVPEALFDGMRAFLENRPEWDQYRVITSALAGFLFQNGCGDRCVAQHYLNGLFMKPGE
jgi:hypothetical protein